MLPATDRIYEFKYGETDHDVQISDHVTALYRQIDFLKDFNIVDTPGTNTIVANHQEITENFVPMADLIVFVFAVTNPWAASAWDFLRLIGQQWKKNIVFVIQQADLRDPDEVEIVCQASRSNCFANSGSELSDFCRLGEKGLPGENLIHCRP